MSVEPVVLVNGLGRLAVSVMAVLLAFRLGKEKGCVLEKPLYLLAISFFVMGLLDLLWSTGVIAASSADNFLVIPFFHLTVLAVWFYVVSMVSGHENMFYLIAVFIMGVNAFLLFSELNVIADVITGLSLMGVFFFFRPGHVKSLAKVSAGGMIYGIAVSSCALLAHFTGVPYISSFWFIPSAVLFYVMFTMMGEDDVCGMAPVAGAHHVPVVVEVFRLGLFVAGLSVFLMLGVLGVHELGHSLAAGALGCSHETSFGIGYAVTHVACGDGSGETLITLAGFGLTLLISALMFFAGNAFARRMSLLMFAFSFIIASDDFSVLGMTRSFFVIIIFASALLIGYGLMKIVQNYEAEYVSREARACTSPLCKGKGI